jgi:hypothetical protein
MERKMTAQARLRPAMAVALLAIASVAAAQQTVNTTDIQRLQDQVFQAGSEVSRLRSTDSSRASRLESELDDVRDEVTYLKVKLRKEGSVNRAEYAELRDRVQDIRSRARGETTSSSSSGSSRDGISSGAGSGAGNGSGTSGGVYDTRRDDRRPSGSTIIPEGTELDTRLQNALSSSTAQVEDRFEATTIADLYRGNDVLIPAGSILRGVVSSVNPATRTDRKGSLTVAFDEITVKGRRYQMRGTVTQALESEGIRGEVGRIGAGSAIGGIIGGIIGGVKGAVLGVLIGGGGTIAATEGKDVNLPPGTILRVRLDSPPDIR